MPTPIICSDARVRQFAEAFRACFSPRQFPYFVTVLLALLLCQAVPTLSNLLRTVVAARSLAGLSRWLNRAPWSPTALVAVWTARWRTALEPAVAAETACRRAARGPRRGRPPQALVTGYLIGDDSVCVKARAHQAPRRPRTTTRPAHRMAAVGQHYASTAKRTVQGHDVVLTCYSLLGRRCPQAPALYRQKTVCEQEGGPFASKIELFCEQIAAFTPVADTRTHVLTDSWYTCKQVWRAARTRGFAITGGLKSNRWLWRPEPGHPAGGSWQRVKDYAASLTAGDYTAVTWPGSAGGRTVYVHVIRTRVRKLYTCQVVLVRESLDGPVGGVRYWASSDLDGETATLIGHIAERWTIEVLIGDSKELGLDGYQVLSAEGIVRWWTLVLALYVFLEEAQAAQHRRTGMRPTIGEVRRQLQQAQTRQLVGWIYTQFQQGVTPDELQQRLATAA